ncbi:MAG: hypothetical protein J2P46_15140 [Zavarzinella sp.]|nr:hypothetical protein [Zavarzinella sp.]
MRAAASLCFLLSPAAAVIACPWTRHACYPCPVIVVPACYPPPVYYPLCPPAIRVTEPPVPESPKAPVVREDVAPEGWCHIRGRVVFDGDPVPKQAVIPNARGALTEDWVVDPDTRGVKNVIVWLGPEPTAEQWKALKATGAGRLREFPSFAEKDIYPGLPRGKDQTVLILEAPIAFIPHIVAVRSGSDVVFRNLSTRPENVKWSSRNNDEVSPLIPPGNEFRMKKTKPERWPIPIESSINPWMKAYVRVFDHPYFAVTAPDGTFEIKYAPKGNLRLFVWQETTGYRNGPEGRFGEPIQVSSGRLDLGDIKIKPRP